MSTLYEARDVGNHNGIFTGHWGRHHAQLRGQGGECIVCHLRAARRLLLRWVGGRGVRREWGQGLAPAAFAFSRHQGRRQGGMHSRMRPLASAAGGPCGIARCPAPTADAAAYDPLPAMHPWFSNHRLLALALTRGMAAVSARSSVLFPALGTPTRPTSASSLSSNSRRHTSPGWPRCEARRGGGGQ